MKGKTFNCHVCKEQTEHNLGDENESPICPDCSYKIDHQNNFSTEDDLAIYQEYGWKYQK